MTKLVYTNHSLRERFRLVGAYVDPSQARPMRAMAAVRLGPVHGLASASKGGGILQQTGPRRLLQDSAGTGEC